MASVAEQAAAHYRKRKALVLAADRAALRLWEGLDPHSLRSTWAVASRALLAVITQAQQLAAAAASPYVTGVLTEQGAGPAPAINAAALAGVASDGRELATLLEQPLITTLTAIGRGVSLSTALMAGQTSVRMIAGTQVADAGRVADGVAITGSRHGGYVRMLSPPSCSRCAVLAGRWYAWNAGFDRHPRCFPAGVVVSGPESLAASRRPYEGELTVIRTASGQELPATGNHPVLTDRGWIPANLIQEGDYVVRSLGGQRATALVVPHEDQMPTRIEDCWRPDGVMPLLHMPTTAEDFHGDGGHGDVDVVFADRLLRHGLNASIGELAEQIQLAGGIAESFDLAGLRSADELFEGLLSSAYGGVGAFSLLPALVGSHPAGSDLTGCGHVSDLYPGANQASAYDVPRNAVSKAQAVLALPGSVRGSDFVVGQHQDGARWDAPSGPFSVDNRVAYAAQGADLLRRLAGQVELDRVIEVRSNSWSGHVYNLTSVEGWYSANSLIVSNCDCISIPAAENIAGDLVTSPKAYFASLSPADQNRIFTNAGAEAIRDGADIGQVVNARRKGAMYTAGGRNFTTESTSRRGTSPGVRPMPEQLYADAKGDRDQAIELLKKFGYLL